MQEGPIQVSYIHLRQLGYFKCPKAFMIYISHIWASLEAQMVKSLPVMQVWSLGQEDPLEKGMATHSCIPAWRISWIEEPGGLQSLGSQRVKQDWTMNAFTFRGFPGDTSKEPTCQCRRQKRPGFDS